jgi:hypothetical protein
MLRVGSRESGVRSEQPYDRALFVTHDPRLPTPDSRLV